jgi:hypothetical protein
MESEMEMKRTSKFNSSGRLIVRTYHTIYEINGKNEFTR